MTEENKVYLLTENANTKRQYIEMLKSEKGLPSDIEEYIIDLHEYISMHQDQFPELVNFMGFQDEEEAAVDQENISGDRRLFEDHLTFEDMVIGVKEGRYFQGRLNVSRLVQSEAVVKVQGLANDILLTNVTDQNRALNGDIVCIEIHPDT
jgi:exosome complex exonuclease DIS3/RRP44